MIDLQWGIILGSGLIPLIVGGLWYGPLFGKTWQKVAEVSDEKVKDANMFVMFGLTILCGMMIAVGITPLVIHQMGVFSALQNVGINVAGSPADLMAQEFMKLCGSEFRTFGHGALHGFMASLFIGGPIMAVNAMFERKSIAYVLLNVGYWTISVTLMGGVICAYA